MLGAGAIIFFVIAFSMITLYTLIFIPHLSDRFKQIPWLFVVPVLAFLSIANIPHLVAKQKYLQAFIFSSLTVAFLLILVALELYPCSSFQRSIRPIISRSITPLLQRDP